MLPLELPIPTELLVPLDTSFSNDKTTPIVARLLQRLSRTRGGFLLQPTPFPPQLLEWVQWAEVQQNAIIMSQPFYHRFCPIKVL